MSYTHDDSLDLCWYRINEGQPYHALPDNGERFLCGRLDPLDIWEHQPEIDRREACKQCLGVYDRRVARWVKA